MNDHSVRRVPNAELENPLVVERIHSAALLPHRATDGSIGLDLHALCVSETGRTNHVILAPRLPRNIPTGLRIKLPAGHFGMIAPRSGLASKGICILGGIIDPDYRGEIRVMMLNGGHEVQYIRNEDRIAQLLIIPIVWWQRPIEGIVEVDTSRGEAGFGSTGR